MTALTTKETVLAFLEESKGRPVSGSTIAAALGISRAAVWKAIHALEADGYSIQAVNRLGYSLSEESDLLSPQAIRPYLSHPAVWPDIQVYPTLSSTNTRAKELAVQGAPSGTVVIADEQSGGRGRLGRVFSSPRGSGVYLTALLRPQTEVETSLLLTSASAVAVCRAIRAVCGLETRIKWVNDVYCGERKLCGILTEASMDFESRTLDYVAVGIGINVRDTAFPPEVAERATSLQRELGGQLVSRCQLAAQLLNELETVLDGLSERRFLTEYRARSLLPGRPVDVITWGPEGPAGSHPRREPGVVREIDDMTRLVVRMDTGEVRVLDSGEVTIRPREPQA